MSLSVAERMVETLADGRLVHVDNAAHMVFEDNPGDFNAVRWPTFLVNGQKQ